VGNPYNNWNFLFAEKALNLLRRQCPALNGHRISVQQHRGGGTAAYLILFLLGFALILIAWKLISHALDLVARLPGLHFLNKTCGALFGLVQACVLLFVAAWLLQFFGHVLPESLVNQTHLLKFFMTTNPLSLLSGL
jgi:uncharacterized membrane protein required for colicin V production